MGEEVAVYGHLASQPSRSVMIFCEVSKIKYRLHEVNFLAGENLRRAFRSINPYGEIPAIVYQGYNLWESCAIIQYLADKFSIDNQYFPKNPEIRGRILAYLHFHHENIRRPIVNYMKKKIFFPMMLGRPEPTAQQEMKLKKKAMRVSKDLEWILSETGFVARTPQPTIADIFAFNELLSGYIVGVQIAGNKNLEKWFETIAEIPEVKEICKTTLNEYRSASNTPKL